MVKANGENAQISYSSQIKSWIICSKNVAMALRTRKDMELYPQHQKRYTYTRLIAEEWFNILQKIEKTYDKNKILELQNDLNQCTFVGEYCGNINCQHLVKYEAVTIYFYAVVKHHSANTCEPPNTAYQIFQKYGLDTVQKTDLKVCDNW